MQQASLRLLPGQGFLQQLALFLDAHALPCVGWNLHGFPGSLAGIAPGVLDGVGLGRLVPVGLGLRRTP